MVSYFNNLRFYLYTLWNLQYALMIYCTGVNVLQSRFSLHRSKHATVKIDEKINME